jgi:serine protease AprX
MASTRSDQPLKVIVRCRPALESGVLSTIGARMRRRLVLDHSVAATLSGSEIARLAASSAVERIEADLPVHATRESSQASFGVTKARSDFDLWGDGDGDPQSYSARDHTIAVIDTGIDGQHQDFAGGKIIAWQDLVNGLAQPYDDNGHGTHCASIAAGALNPAGVGGVAPAAALIGLKVLSSDGSGDSSTIAQAVEWCIQHRDEFGIQAISLSLATDESSDGTDALSRTINQAVDAGIVVCVAAGNAGPDRYTIGSPAAAAEAITVGNMIDTGKGGFALEPSSSRGPTADERVKPDLCAPGAGILAAQANTRSGYIRMTGTSMATPFVAGLAILMREADPTLSPAQIKSIMKGTAVHFGPAGENNDFGAGRLDGYAALEVASGRGGTGPDVPRHLYFSGQLTGAGGIQRWNVRVEDLRFPLAASLIVDADSAAFDLTVYDPLGRRVGATSSDAREEMCTLSPASTGIYTLVVRSFAGGGAYSLDLSAGARAPDPPAAPGNLSVSAVSTTQVGLTWTGSSPDETGVEIWRRISAGAYTLAATAGPGAIRFTDRGLVPGAPYTYEIRAVNSGGASAWSNEVTAVTLPEPPAPPSGLVAVAISRSQINLSWTDRSTTETGFELFRRSGAGNFVRVGAAGANETRYSDTGLSAGATYTYRVRALNGSAASSWSNTASSSTLPDPPGAPSGLSVRATAPRQLVLTWKDKSANETGFVIWRKSGAGDFTRAGAVGANVTWFTDRGLADGILYTYRLSAINTGGASGWSNQASAATAPAPPIAPSGLSARAASSMEIDLTWADKSSDETGFEVWRKSGAGAFTRLRTLGPNITHFEDRGLISNVSYTYCVRAINSGGSSAWTNDAGATTPPVTRTGAGGQKTRA